MSALLVLPLASAAQEGCQYGDQGNDVLQSITLQGGARITYVTNPHFVCEDGVQIWADSAVAYQAEAMSHLLGAVRYLEGSREMHADEARYFSNVGRLQAQGNVSIVDRSDGSSVRNGDLVYLRLTDFRDEEEMTVTTGADGFRPSAVFVRSRTDSASAEPTAPEDVEPYTVVADRIFTRGASYLSALGNVEIVRDSLYAFADSADYDGSTDELLLEGSARVVSSSNDLVGRTITMVAVGNATDEVRALRDAVLTGVDLRLTAPLIIARLTDGAVQQIVAIPLPSGVRTEADSVELPRPIAIAQDFELTGDSLQLTSPGDVLERIYAAGTARSVSRARDSLNVEGLPEMATTDWLEGDTIEVTFTPAAESEGVPSTSAEPAGYEVDTIVARVGARSLYRLLPSDTTARAGEDLPAVHYVVGDQITIRMNAGEVEGMQVIGQTQGVHLEPLSLTVTVSDSSEVAPPDTAAVGRGNEPDLEPGRRP